MKHQNKHYNSNLTKIKEGENKISKVYFLGRESECNKDGRIMGGGQRFWIWRGVWRPDRFATDLQNLLDFSQNSI